MTVNYHSQHSKVQVLGHLQLLARWRGSVYKLLRKEFLIYFSMYALISVVYRFALNENQKGTFEAFAIVCTNYASSTPLNFLLGFYVTTIVNRWWDQLRHIPYPDGVCKHLVAFLSKECLAQKVIPQTIARYLVAAFVLRVRKMGSAAGGRFPTLQHVVDEGLLTQDELALLERVPSQYLESVPCQWISRLLREACERGYISEAIMFRIMSAVDGYSYNLRWLNMYDRVSLPLVYTQVVTLATYAYFLVQLVGKQFLRPELRLPGHQLDYYVPIFTMFEFLFLFGWFKVAEALMNPFGDDDDDFEIDAFITRHKEMSQLLVNELWSLSGQLPCLSNIEVKNKPADGTKNGNTLSVSFVNATLGQGVVNLGYQNCSLAVDESTKM